MLFITIAGNAVGYGHLNRCLSLAGHAANRNVSISFLLFGDNEASARVQHTGYKFFLKPISAIGRRFTDAVPYQIEAADVIVIDLSHPVVFSDLEGTLQLLKHIRSRARQVILIDALGEQTFAAKMPNMPIDILVAPYVGVTVQDSPCWRTLKGPAYAVLSPAYEGLHERIVRQHANRLLVSCGGSDPTMLTPLVLEGIERLHRELNIRVIVGPLFDRNLKATLRNVASASRHSIELVDAPDGLVGHMRWCDLAITTSGLIKYELAATSTPGILLSIDNIHDLSNRPFADLGSALDLGSKVTAQLIADSVESLLDNYAARRDLAASGRRMFDGKGSERLLNEIIRSCYVTE